MELGQRVVCRPVALVEYELNGNKAVQTVRTGEICYIHPEGRFVTVAFEGRRGQVLKESFKPWEVKPTGKRK